MTVNANGRLSAWMDEPQAEPAMLEQLLDSPKLQQQYSRYRLIGDSLRGELQGPLAVDISSREMAALADEPTVLAPKKVKSSLWQRRIQPMLRQSGQLAVAASVAALVVVGVQQFNQRPQDITSPILETRPFGGTAAPVSMSLPLSHEQANHAQAQQAAEQRRRLQAYLKDHQQQVRLDVIAPQADMAVSPLADPALAP